MSMIVCGYMPSFWPLQVVSYWSKTNYPLYPLKTSIMYRLRSTNCPLFVSFHVMYFNIFLLEILTSHFICVFLECCCTRILRKNPSSNRLCSSLHIKTGLKKMNILVYYDVGYFNIGFIRVIAMKVC